MTNYTDAPSQVARVNTQEIARRGRIAAAALHSRHDPKHTTANTRAAFNQRFLDEVDPERKLPTEERERRAGYAKKAHYAKLSYRRWKNQRERGATRGRAA